jgi:hypothetical protein
LGVLCSLATLLAGLFISSGEQLAARVSSWRFDSANGNTEQE